MTRKQAIYILKNLAWLATEVNTEKTEQAVNMAIKALEQEPCEDAVSRRAVFHMLDEVGGDFDKPREAVVPLDYIADMIGELPPVQPKRQTGKWKRTPLLTCDHCNKINKGDVKSDFCPNCGSYNGGDDNGNE